MHTATGKEFPGKFEGCPSQKLGEILYDIILNGGTADNIGEVEITGIFSLIKGKRYGFITEEDNNGFFTYEIFDLEGAGNAWEVLLDAMAEYEADIGRDVEAEEDARKQEEENHGN